MMKPKPSVRFDTVEFIAGDGMRLNLQHAVGEIPATKGPVLLVHGAGVSANIFNAPVDTTIIDFLISHGYDVWLENWRGSLDFEFNPWTLDKVAVYDHPYAVRKVIEVTGATAIKAIVHCQGSTSFMMSAVAGLVPQVDTIISNAVSLHPLVPLLSKIKINLAPPVVGLFTDDLDPRRAVAPTVFWEKLLRSIVEALHHECDNLVCRYTSFMYGSGHPTLWRHENLNEVTHQWLSNEFGFLPMAFYRQIGRSINKGHLLSIGNFSELPRDFVECRPQTSARFAFFAGSRNVCFLPESQRRTFDHFNKIRPGYHSLHVINGYGHLCMFMGKNAAVDVFPLMLDELEKKVSTVVGCPRDQAD